MRAFAYSPIVTFLFVGVPATSSITWSKSALAVAVPIEVNAVIFLSAIFIS
jgi:hypothetical protein